MKKAINCDQVTWLLDIFGRYLPMDNLPGVSQQREMMKYGMLYEVMEIADLHFEDQRAQWNGTPNPARYNARTYEETELKRPQSAEGVVCDRTERQSL